MRIGIVVNTLGGGGAERQAAHWAEVCSTLGHATQVLVLGPGGSDYALSPHICVEHFGKSGRLDLMRLVRRLRAAASDLDLLIAFQAYPMFCCALARSGVPILLRTGQDPRYWQDTTGVPRPLLRAAFARARIACAPSRGLVECHRELGILPGGPWMAVPNIVDEQAFQSGGPRHGALFVGRLVPVKDPLLAVEAALTAQVELTVLGDGELRGAIEERASEAPPSTPIRLLSFTRRPWEVYPRHRVLLVTSRYEAFSAVIIESLAAGTPVVSVDCDFGPREILAGATYSELVPSSREALAGALTRVLGRPHGEAEAAECRAIAARYRVASVSPLIDEAITRTVSGVGAG